MGKNDGHITLKGIDELQQRSDIFKLLESKNGKRAKKLINTIEYEQELLQLQIELGKLQQWVKNNGKRLAIILEGRDAAGKGGTIKRFIQYLNPREMRVVALPKPTDAEKGQWYFRRYIKQLPNAGEIVFFDRSWYNRAVVEPVNGFCTEKQYKHYMTQVNQFEHMLHNDGLIVIKFWLDITKDEQKERFDHNDIDEDLAVKCAMMHDTIEDTTLEYTDIENKYGKKVADGVMALTKNDNLPDKRTRMLDSLQRIKQQSKEVWMVKMADRITNLYASPYYWDNEKKKAYREEAIVIYDHLKDGSDYLANRLKQKIDEYQKFIN